MNNDTIFLAVAAADGQGGIASPKETIKLLPNFFPANYRPIELN